MDLIDKNLINHCWYVTYALENSISMNRILDK